MSIQFPDISQYTPVPLAGAPVAIARATISTVTDTHWAAAAADAASHNVPLLAYCFLNAGSLGVSPEAQADYAWSVVGQRPVMLDWEPNRGACATVGEACRWIDRLRYRGGVCRLVYLPHWAWQGTLGSPGLQTLADRRMVLVSSNYTAYSDSGPGWAPYYPGCPVPVVQWQYSDQWPFNGAAVDWNAYRGSVTDYLSVASGGAPIRGADDMIRMAHERGSNIDWIGNGIFRWPSPDAAHTTNAKWFMAQCGDPNPTSVEINPGTLDALGPIVVTTPGGVPTTAAVAISDAQMAQLAAAVIASHDTLTDADKPTIEAALRDVLHGA